MHESGLVRSLVHEVEKATGVPSERSQGSKVLSVRVRMGALCSFSESHLREHFARETKGTVAEHASLVVERGPELVSVGALDAGAQDVLLLSIEIEDVVGRRATG